MENFIEKEDLYNLLITRTPNLMLKLLFDRLKKKKITITKEQFSLLVILWQNEGCSQQFLADETFRDKPGITRLIHHLEKAKIVERRTDPFDRRSNLIYLTNKGILLEKKVMDEVRATVEDALSSIDIEEAKIFKKVFIELHQHFLASLKESENEETDE
ncbi:MarR family transcriptional regulator [Ornithobacterium rhinotracheale]|nr:MarR family transcriptional regulator [Ornithobacterium rhinotracheale]MRI62601.1 MarR family transcriptional regulator [Ornithobacterium rhinotracheale]MRJ07688.1 MarR family transcriptional regulator [Ornithobacterium rhinotracheale]MRJ10320.1 MarR family transcriptional regulator [Ornithobacterium rhinotracheale]UOH78284.1 MarR family transcriptional regulator [Ornithobacterium rhinotracheale]